ncbi:CP2 transcription factor-domain-containing protein [Neohortaea acidophila]|uniref:CP2 transcription factor-domain-containing protein n=1 Tax=Neohortaea acidophila TaxID=245834 RepID=A0A6A6PNV9_9PEZI|nr:CP2 transcription factor-domain-containing protein [Neohortaea acidophila]KAF2481486.1 CP2 transcription factor-domain-containing protein [Neohortaea acidophila]
MFRNRRNSQKPTDELLKTFKASYSHLNNTAGGDEGASAVQTDGAALTDAMHDSLNPSMSQQNEPASHGIKDGDTTPRPPSDMWTLPSSGLTPSLMDPNSHAFSMFAGHGYYTPTPGGTNTLFHPQAGELHTPGLSMSLATPLSLPTSEGALHAGHQAPEFHHGFQNHLQQHHVQQHDFPPNVNPYQMHHPTSFPPHQFSHQHSFEHMDGTGADSPVDDMGMDVNLHNQHHSPHMMFNSHALLNVMRPPNMHASGEKFRYHVTLNAPTAMIKHHDEIPITYLNKGQAYTLNVVDTSNKQHAMSRRYRTYVRVSFEDEQQRQKPAACWQLWKEGRGTNEAHQRGGRLQAVEYVESGQSEGVEDPRKPRVELESASFDGFCVQWTPAPGALDCPISVRFNFLSTDFSHSKGVKGIPVRLCAKTEAIDEMHDSAASGPEVSYCKVKLFRDHGAERKLSNDVAHVRKTIEKLQGQIAQIEAGVKDGNKRKRSGSMAKLTGLDHRPAKISKHRRTWSIGSSRSNEGRGSAEDELHNKLTMLQDMFSSTRPASVLHLRGAEEDDPDLHPVKLSGEMLELLRNDSTETADGEERQSSQAGADSSMTSRSPSANSANETSRKEWRMQQPAAIASLSRDNSNDWPQRAQTATEDIDLTPPAQPQQIISPSRQQAVRVQTRPSPSGKTSGWIEALDMDLAYQAPPDRPAKPVACFYVQPRVTGRSTNDHFYRAIYLYRHTLKDFVNAVATKSDIEPTQVLRTVHMNRSGIPVLFDDQCIRELPEGQDMTAEFSEAHVDGSSRPSREWNASSTDVQCDGDLSATENVTTTGYELRLLF